jgi:Xaa-Pro aminopeptidase
MNFPARQKKLREHLATTRFDALLISHLPNIRYLCGFTGSAGLLLVEEAGSVFFTDVRYDTQAHDEVKGREGGHRAQSRWCRLWANGWGAAQAGSGMDDRHRGRALYDGRKETSGSHPHCRPAVG